MRDQERSTGLPPRYAIRLDDLQPWHRIEAACYRCNRIRVLKLSVIKRGRPGHTRLMDIEHKLRCTACGRRGDHALTVSLAPRD